MGILDRLLGREDRRARQATPPWGTPPPAGAPVPPRTEADADAAAIARYRYLLRTAPPEAIEQAHAEAFAQLTPDQRRQVLTSLGRELPDAAWARSYDPHSLARLATRAEVRRPGTLERVFGHLSPGAGGFGGGGGFGGVGGRGGLGMGGVLAGSLLASVAGAFIGTAVADALLPDDPDVFDSGAYDVSDGGLSTDPDDYLDDDRGGDAPDSLAGGFSDDDSGDGDFGDFGDDFGGDLDA